MKSRCSVSTFPNGGGGAPPLRPRLIGDTRGALVVGHRFYFCYLFHVFFDRCLLTKRKTRRKRHRLPPAHATVRFTGTQLLAGRNALISLAEQQAVVLFGYRIPAYARIRVNANYTCYTALSYHRNQLFCVCTVKTRNSRLKNAQYVQCQLKKTKKNVVL